MAQGRLMVIRSLVPGEMFREKLIGPEAPGAPAVGDSRLGHLRHRLRWHEQ